MGQIQNVNGSPIEPDPDEVTPEQIERLQIMLDAAQIPTTAQLIMSHGRIFNAASEANSPGDFTASASVGAGL